MRQVLVYILLLSFSISYTVLVFADNDTDTSTVFINVSTNSNNSSTNISISQTSDSALTSINSSTNSYKNGAYSLNNSYDTTLMSMYEMGFNKSTTILPSKNPLLNLTPPVIEDDVENVTLSEEERSIVDGGFGDNISTGDVDNRTIRIAYQDWIETVLATNIAKAIFEEMGYKVVLVKTTPDAIFEDVSDSAVELSFGAWSTMEEEFNNVRGELERMNKPWFTGAQSGLAVPDYVNISEIEDLKNTTMFLGRIHTSSLNNRAASGAIKSLTKYDMKYRVFSDNGEGNLVNIVDHAVANKEPILVATWTPSPMFAKYKMKFLEDTEGAFDDFISIYKIARLDFYKSYPDAYAVISSFNLTNEEASAMLLQELNGVPVESIAKQWVENNRAKIDEWRKSGQQAALNQ